MTLSPTFTSSGTRLPLSSMRPGPIATTSPSWGFSLAVSGMTRPEAVVCSASIGCTTIRSSRGLMLTDTSDQPPRICFVGDESRWGACIVGTPSRGSHLEHMRWQTHGESASTELSTLPQRVPTHLAPPSDGRGRGSRDDGRVDLDAFRWLLTEPGQRLLTRASAASPDPLEAAADLRR